MSSSTPNSSVSPDSNHSTGSSFFDALAAKPMALVSLILGIIVVAAVVVGIRSQRESKAQAANSALFQAQKSLESEIKALVAANAPAAPAKGEKPKQAPSAESLQFKKLDVDAKFPEAVKNFKSVVEHHPGTRASFEAQLALGSLYGDHGDAAKAAPWFQQAATSADNSLDRAQALSAYGSALEGSGKYAEAIAAFQKALDQGDTGMKSDLLMAVARNQELAGDKAKARDTYDQVIKQFPNSEQAHSAEYLKAQLK